MFHHAKTKPHRYLFMIIRDSQSVLKDYYESGASYYQIARKYDVATGNVIAWERKYMNKCVPLPSDIQELEKRGFNGKESKRFKTSASYERRRKIKR